jgi:hypothetical protein
MSSPHNPSRLAWLLVLVPTSCGDHEIFAIREPFVDTPTKAETGASSQGTGGQAGSAQDGGCRGQVCGDTCVDTLTDTLNCGSCGRNCPLAATCDAGECVCAPPLRLCADRCVAQACRSLRGGPKSGRRDS